MAIFKKTIQRGKHLCFTSSKQRAFLEDITALIEDGISVNHAIEMHSAIAKGLTAELIVQIKQTIAKGHPFAEGLHGWYPQTVIAIVRAGEESGTLTRALRAATSALVASQQIVTSFLSILTYPLVVITMGLIVAVFVNHSILMDFRLMLPVNRWPDIAVSFSSFAFFIEQWWAVLLAFVLVTSFVVSVTIVNYVGPLRPWLDSLPIFNFYRKMTAARFLEMLGILLSNGLVLKQALVILKRQTVPYLAWHVQAMEYRLGGGKEDMGEVLDTGMIDTQEILRLRLITKTSHFEEALERLGRFSAHNCLQRMQVQLRLVSGACLLLAAALAAVMIFSIYGVGAVLGSY